ncbi:hypothetical protein [Nostoc linckia]|uniref:hypothetical protein n=1 Tax=Nostoc linckia TaxID=92942 RepID=UPI0015D4E836|nr:hypothetical protein [Nostoc linckia]
MAEVKENSEFRIQESGVTKNFLFLFCPMPNDATCSTWGDPKTAVAPQCPIPHAQARNF